MLVHIAASAGELPAVMTMEAYYCSEENAKGDPGTMPGSLKSNHCCIR